MRQGDSTQSPLSLFSVLIRVIVLLIAITLLPPMGIWKIVIGVVIINILFPDFRKALRQGNSNE